MQKPVRLTLWLLLVLANIWPLLGQFALAAGAAPAIANSSIRQEKVELAEPRSTAEGSGTATGPISSGLPKSAGNPRSARISDTIQGHHAIEYLIDARTGQSLELDLRSNNVQASYHITAPAAPRALHKGHGLHARYSVTLPRDGTYKVLVYLMESAAEKGESANFLLKIRLRDPG
ncbi:hypothetical protein [Microbulbifer sp. ALW1]|uniref:hypothetical protein n=1 Tax=Microbulbifer sp. (strain ALW1) TaxID=1516059 RepID=UPI0013579F58|nr:hypothetical protein [Microbulbifer sp. ALW1]